jgi:hypothetical protein
MTLRITTAAAGFALLMAVAPPHHMPALAEDAAAPAAAAPAAAVTPAASTPVPAVPDVKPSDNPPEAELTAEEKAEKEGRKVCKASICSAFRTKQAAGGDIACSVVKSWRKEQLGKLVGKLKVSWPYGPVRCTTTVNLKRADLVKAMTDDKVDVKLDTHHVACTVEREKDPPTDITFDFSPTVKFEKGKATKAKINWGKLEAPTATAADNTVNILSGTLVEDINDFIGKKCDEVKDQWAEK